MSRFLVRSINLQEIRLNELENLQAIQRDVCVRVRKLSTVEHNRINEILEACLFLCCEGGKESMLAT